jgi:glycerate-2-kinase
VRAALAAADAAELVRAAVRCPAIAPALAGPVHVVAAGKAALDMAAALVEEAGDSIERGVIAAREAPDVPLLDLEVFAAGHPVPNEASVAAGLRALEIARTIPSLDTMLVLLSGGASAMLDVPAAGLTLADAAAATRALLLAGADIAALNCVRKHLSRIKGGQLAAMCAGRTLTLAISDVVTTPADEPSAIGSGPTVADPTTFAQAFEVIDRLGIRRAMPARAIETLERGARGALADTPKPGDRRLARSAFHLIGSRAHALDGARRAAESLGYRAYILDEPVVGEARLAAEAHAAAIARVAPRLARPACLLSAGETTVRVRGGGRGGRNMEFALAFALVPGAVPRAGALASIGTDGLDGPTDAAGAIVDGGTLERAARAGLDRPGHYLDGNDTYAFFSATGDLVRTGPTGTNVGDLQVLLLP